MKSKTITFELHTRFSGRWREDFEVKYELFVNGHTILKSVMYDDFPLDIEKLSEAKEGTFLHWLYGQIIAAMANNAESKIEEVRKEFPQPEDPFKDIFKMINNINKVYSRSL